MDLTNVKMFHLKVICDENTGELIYDRKLEDGSGPAIYGLEVCKAMDMDRDFIGLAEEIRRELLDIPDKILEEKTSHYNSEVYLDRCYICDKKADDAHHIKFQCTAKDNIIDEHIVKDIKSNLVPLCKICHNKVHNGEIDIEGYKKTSSGVKLEYNFNSTEKIQETKKKNRKLTDNQIDIIRDIKNEVNRITHKDIKIHMEQKHGINVSVGTIGKVLRGGY